MFKYKNLSQIPDSSSYLNEKQLTDEVSRENQLRYSQRIKSNQFIKNQNKEHILKFNLKLRDSARLIKDNCVMNNDCRIIQYKLTHTSDPDVIKNFNSVRHSIDYSNSSKKNNPRRIKIDKSNVKSKQKNNTNNNKLPEINSPTNYKLSLSEADEQSLNLPFQSFRQQSKEILQQLDQLTSVDEESRKRKVVTNGVKNSQQDKDVKDIKSKTDQYKRQDRVDYKKIIEDIQMEDVQKFRKLNDNQINRNENSDDEAENKIIFKNQHLK